MIETSRADIIAALGAKNSHEVSDSICLLTTEIGNWYSVGSMTISPAPPEVQTWPIDKLVFYARNPRKNDAVVDRMCGSIREFGFKIPVLARSDGEVVDGHLRLKAARKLGIAEIPVILCDEWTDQQVKAFRLLVNRSVTWAAWDEELLGLELQDLNAADFDLSLTGFNPGEIDALLAIPDEERANDTPPVAENPMSRIGDLWLCGDHRALCGNSTSADDVARLLGDRKPTLMVTDPPYGIELDSEWRDRAGLNTAPGHKRTTASKAAAKGNLQYPAEASYMKHWFLVPHRRAIHPAGGAMCRTCSWSAGVGYRVPATPPRIREGPSART
ncbi:MAG: ParB N-terminal domain-containing protein [Candidatus Solibacter sp.]